MHQLWMINMDLRYSKQNSQRYYEIELFSEESCTMFKTYVSPDNDNWVQWKELIAIAMAHPDDAVCITGKFRVKPKYPSIVNADCKPVYQTQHDRDDLLQAIYELYLK